MKRSRFWLSAWFAAVLIGCFSFQWGINTAQAQTAVDPFTVAARDCLTQPSLDACDRAIAINSEDPIPWYGKFAIHEAAGEIEAAQDAFVKYDLATDYHRVLLVLSQQLREHLFFKNLLADENQPAALSQEIANTQTAANNTGLSAEQRQAAQVQLERLNNVRRIYDELKADPQKLTQSRQEAIAAMIDVREKFAEAIASDTP
ncbi:MAG: hypothetical protein F6J87_30335 [Spirulina sp. SIO3F2]|nr:hypothetical protein [Spirulina sp. SIO3F2]